MRLLLLCVVTAFSCAPAFAGAFGASAPELDAGTLAAVSFAVTGAYFAYRIQRSKTKKSLEIEIRMNHMLSALFVLVSLAICSPAFAGVPASAPELDPGSLAALTSGLTGAYIIYRVYRSRNKC